MADTATRGVEIEAVVLCEVFDVAILGEVVRGSVLDVVIERADDLTRVVDLSGAEAEELAGDGPGVVVGHHVAGLDGDVVTCADGTGAGDDMSLDDFLGEVLGASWEHGGGRRATQSVGRGGRSFAERLCLYNVQGVQLRNESARAAS